MLLSGSWRQEGALQKNGRKLCIYRFQRYCLKANKQFCILYVNILMIGKTTAAKQDNSNVSNYSLYIKEHL